MDKLKKVLSTIRKHKILPIAIILLVIIFFSIRLIITWDSAHYLGYVEIFENRLPASSWDVVRGPVFPALIYLSDVIFGKTSAGILILTFLFYLITTISCYILIQQIFKNSKHRKLYSYLTLIIAILNPLILGYFHVLLTEFVAITLTILNILIAYKWIYTDIHNKKHLAFYSVYFVLNTVFCYHLKQPYIIIGLVPLITAAIIAIIQKHTIKSIAYRLGTIAASIIALFFSIGIWNIVLTNMGVDFTTNRDSESMLSSQLLSTYNIFYDPDSDGKPNQVSTLQAIGLIANELFTDPLKIGSIYLSNYCSLTSNCIIETNDGVKYVATFNFAGEKTYENSIIGYRPYSSYSNIFDMTDELQARANVYGESSDRSLIAGGFSLGRIPTNILFKISTALCLPLLVFLIIIKVKYKNKTYNNLFYLSLILIITSFSHLAISAGLGLIIDRYAIEIFIPSFIGLISSGAYFYYCRLSTRQQIKGASR